MANTNITLENLLELAQAATSIGDGDYIFIYKAGANGFSKIEKNVFFQGIAASAGGGMSDEVYAAIQNNVEALRSILYALTKTWLANLAFTNGRPSDTLLASIASQFTWPDNEGGSSGGDTPTPTNPTLSLPASGVNILIGTNTGSGISKVVNIQGSNLTQQLNVVVSGTGFALSADGLTTQTLITANAANNGTSVTVYYLGTNTNGESGTLTISSYGTGTDNINRTVNIAAVYQAQGGGEEPTGDPTISVSPSSLSFNAEVGQSAQQTFSVSGSNLTGNIQLSSNSNLFTYEVISGQLTPDANNSVNATVRVTYTPTAPTASGTDSGTITVSSTGAANQTVSLNGTATAAASTVNVVYKLLNISAPSTATQDQVWGYYKETVNKSDNFSRTLSAINNATLRGDITVKSGGVVKFKEGGSNNDSGITFNNGTLSIASTVLNSLTDDLIIEATAYTGTVTINASEAVSGGVTINGGSAQNLNSGSTVFNVSTISSLSFASGVKTKITSIDFGGAQFTGQSLESMFSGFTALTQVKGLVVTGSVKTLAKMFKGCTSLQVFDTIGWDTSAVTTIAGLAYNCSALTKVDLGSKDMGELVYAGDDEINTQYPTDETVFSECTNLAHLDVSHWNAKKLVSLWGFLYKCTSLESFDASTWKNATKIWNLHGMFASCSALTEIDISGIDTSDSNVTPTISHMFDTCRNLTDLTIKNFDMSRVTDISSIWWAANRHITLHCKSTNPANCALHATDSMNWIKEARSNSTSKGFIEYIKVPVGSRNSYLSNTGWAAFSSIISEE